MMSRALPHLALVLVLAGCAGREAAPAASAASPSARHSDVTVVDIQLGRAVAPDRRVAQPLDSFAPGDVIYASVVTEGSASSARLKAGWTRENGEIVAESWLDIAPSGTTVSEFHISKADGLPPGRYQVEVFLDGVSGGKRAFSVR
jgi:hypothetical protein